MFLPNWINISKSLHFECFALFLCPWIHLLWHGVFGIHTWVANLHMLFEWVWGFNFSPQAPYTNFEVFFIFKDAFLIDLCLLFDWKPLGFIFPFLFFILTVKLEYAFWRDKQLRKEIKNTKVLRMLSITTNDFFFILSEMGCLVILTIELASKIFYLKMIIFLQKWKVAKIILQGGAQSLHMIEHFSHLGYYVPRKVEKVLGLKHEFIFFCKFKINERTLKSFLRWLIMHFSCWMEK